MIQIDTSYKTYIGSREQCHREWVAVRCGDAGSDDKPEERVAAIVAQPGGVDDAQARKADQHDRKLEDDREEREQDQNEIDRVGDAEGRCRDGIGDPDAARPRRAAAR